MNENLALREPRLVGGGKARGHRLWEVPLLERAELKPVVKKTRLRVVVTKYGDPYEGDDEEAYVCEGMAMAKEERCPKCSCLMVPLRIVKPADFITVIRSHEKGCRHNVKAPLMTWPTRKEMIEDLRNFKLEREKMKDVLRETRKVKGVWVLPDSCQVLETRVDLVI